MTVRRPWTAADDVALRAARFEPIAALAARLGRTAGAVVRRRQQLGIAAPRRSWTPEAEAELLDRLDRGETVAAAAEAMDIGFLSAYGKARALGWRGGPAGRRWSAAEDRAVLRWITETDRWPTRGRQRGPGAAGVARMLGRTEAAIRARARLLREVRP